MSVGQDAVGSVYQADLVSLGSATGSGPYTYTEQYPGTLLGSGATATVDSVVTTNGTTTIDVTISNSAVFNGQVATTLVGNDATDALLYGDFPAIGDAYIYVANSAAQQPGPGNTVNVAPESANITYMPLCFTTGTSILTERGPVAVEDLQIGDFAATVSGALRPITWVGQQLVDCRTLPVPCESWPVRIVAGAFGGDLPERDLVLSPGHPVLVDSGAEEVLVPIMCLINGTTIYREPVSQVTYWHIELDAHDILLAEGLPAESFLDWGNRLWFANGAEHTLANPDFIPPGLGGRCRPVALGGPLVEAERRRLDTVFHASLVAPCAWPTETGAAFEDSWSDGH